MSQGTSAVHPHTSPARLQSLRAWWRCQVRPSVPSEACRDHYGEEIFYMMFSEREQDLRPRARACLSDLAGPLEALFQQLKVMHIALWGLGFIERT